MKKRDGGEGTKKGGRRKKGVSTTNTENDVMFKQAWMYVKPTERWYPPPVLPNNVTKTPNYVKPPKRKLPPRGQ